MAKRQYKRTQRGSKRRPAPFRGGVEIFTQATTPEEIVKLIHAVLIEFMGHAFHHEMQLMVGTVAAESGFTKRFQRGGGPARGIFQIELATARDNYVNYMKFPQWRHRYKKLMQMCCCLGSAPFFVPSDEDIEHLLIGDDRFSIIHARIKYLRDPQAIPSGNWIKEIAEYYKRVFNTEEGKGSVQKFVEAYFHHDCPTLIAPYAAFPGKR